MVFYIYTTEEVARYLADICMGATPRGCSVRNLNNKVAQGKIPQNIIVEKGKNGNIWVFTDKDALKKLL
jgi:hypothetical protein